MERADGDQCGDTQLVENAVSAVLAAESRTVELQQVEESISLKVGDVCRIHGLANKIEYNDAHATLVEWKEAKKRWQVELEVNNQKITASIKPENLWMSCDEGIAPPHIQENRDLLDEARRLFVPGALFLGDIVIPGMSQSEAKEEYGLLVSSLFTDELGRRVIMGRHKGYGDEQSCELLLEVKSKGFAPDGEEFVQLTYSDNETVCVGKVNLEEGTIEGQVSQLKHGEDGFYYPSKDVTHVFNLRQVHRINRSVTLASLSRVVVSRARWYEAMEELVKSLEALGPSIKGSARSEPLNFGNDALEVLKRIKWSGDVGSGGVTEQCILLTEDVCATLRRQATLLTEISFEDLSDKREMMAKLKDISRHEAHKCTDIAMQRFSALCEVLLAVTQEDRRARSAGIQELEQAAYKAQIRLSQTFERFDKAMTAFIARPTKASMRSWRKKSISADSQGSLLCMICVSELETNDVDVSNVNENESSAARDFCLSLPCGHRFHESCLSSWLHNNPQCPNCRCDVSETIDTAAVNINTT